MGAEIEDIDHSPIRPADCTTEEEITQNGRIPTNMAADKEPPVVEKCSQNGLSNGYHPVPAIVAQTAKDLAFDIVYHISKAKKERKASSKHAVTLRRTVEEMSQKHEILFNGMVKKLQIDLDNAYIIFTNVANEIFKDGQYNWGRVVSLYAFGARMARHVVETDRTNLKLVDKIAEIVGNFVAKILGKWIHEQGGWDSFDEHFPEQFNLENTMWKGLLVTAGVFGVLATFVAAR